MMLQRMDFTTSIGEDKERHLLGVSLLNEINVTGEVAKEIGESTAAWIGVQVYPNRYKGVQPAIDSSPHRMQCIEWSNPQHLVVKPYCSRWHPTAACRFYPNCLLGADRCRFAHPYCQPLHHFCQCQDRAQLQDQLHHLLPPTRLERRHGRMKPMFHESDVYCELVRIFGGWRNIPRFELSQKDDHTYECQLRFDGLLFAHHDCLSHRKYESRVIVAQQLLDYLMEINIA